MRWIPVVMDDDTYGSFSLGKLFRSIGLDAFNSTPGTSYTCESWRVSSIWRPAIRPSLIIRMWPSIEPSNAQPYGITGFEFHVSCTRRTLEGNTNSLFDAYELPSMPDPPYAPAYVG